MKYCVTEGTQLMCYGTPANDYFRFNTEFDVVAIGYGGKDTYEIYPKQPKNSNSDSQPDIGTLIGTIVGIIGGLFSFFGIVARAYFAKTFSKSYNLRLFEQVLLHSNPTQAEFLSFTDKVMYYVFSFAFGLLVPFLALPLAIKLRDDFVAQLYDARRRGVVDNHNLQTFLSGFLGNGKRKFEFPDSNDALFASIALEILQQINEDGEFHPVGITDNANDAPGQDNNTKNNNIPLPGVNERQISYSRIYPNEETF